MQKVQALFRVFGLVLVPSAVFGQAEISVALNKSIPVQDVRCELTGHNLFIGLNNPNPKAGTGVGIFLPNYLTVAQNSEDLAKNLLAPETPRLKFGITDSTAGIFMYYTGKQKWSVRKAVSPQSACEVEITPGKANSLVVEKIKCIALATAEMLTSEKELPLLDLLELTEPIHCDYVENK